MCLGTRQRRIAEGNASHGFYQLTGAPLHCHARLRGWISVFAEMTRGEVLSVCSTAQFLIATRQPACLSSVIAFVATARPPP